MIAFIRDLGRIFSVSENVLYLLGKSLQRHAMRNGIIISMAYGSALLGIKISGTRPLSQEQIISLLAMAFASYPAGAMFIRLSDFLTRAFTEHTTAGHLHLTSHYKQQGINDHLAWLWRDVFRHEARVRRSLDQVISSRGRVEALQHAIDHALENLPSRIKKDLKLDRDGAVREMTDRVLKSVSHDREVEAVEKLFVYTASYALQTPMPQAIQEMETGFDLSLVEEWYQRGLFVYEDFPGRLFNTDPHVREVLDHLRRPIFNRLGRFLRSETSPSFWYAYSIRKLSVLCGKSIVRLNRQLADTPDYGYFDAQHLLWPSEELEAAMHRQFTGRAENLYRRLLAERRSLVVQVFSRDPDIALKHILRMFRRDYRRIFRLRLAVDSDYLTTDGGEAAIEEMDTINNWLDRAVCSTRQLRRKMDRAKMLRERFDALLNQLPLPRTPDPEELRALHMAWFVDLHHFRRNLESGDAATKQQSIERIMRYAPVFSRRLVSLRLHHCLLKIQIYTYWTLIGELAGYPVTNHEFSLRWK